MKITVVSPHLKDAAFALSLSMESWLAAGHKITLINCFTRSDYALYSDAGSLHENDRASFVTALRRREDQAWRRLFGSALTAIDLNIKDAPLRMHCASEEVYGLTINPQDKWILKIRRAIERENAAAVVLPLALSNHVDHLIARHAGMSVAASDRPCAFYEDLAQSLLPETIKKVADDLSREHRISLQPAFIQPISELPNAVARKRRHILHFDSQINDEEVDRIASQLHEGRERLWVNPGWHHAAFA